MQYEAPKKVSKKAGKKKPDEHRHPASRIATL
jgi:hypothetical protein